ncbi:hypothetical protein Taro_051563 [Colocasia esculenta]|uniref:Uncharacterized protein n=1 Tax=Colocasia esculenta TaxID=4460 RepID=A0A843XG99_COLES|nr:hypothetical protein [Colocasia esculenta]
MSLQLSTDAHRQKILSSGRSETVPACRQMDWSLSTEEHRVQDLAVLCSWRGFGGIEGGGATDGTPGRQGQGDDVDDTRRRQTMSTAHQAQGDGVDADGVDGTPVRPETARTGRIAHQLRRLRPSLRGSSGDSGPPCAAAPVSISIARTKHLVVAVATICASLRQSDHALRLPASATRVSSPSPPESPASAKAATRGALTVANSSTCLRRSSRGALAVATSNACLLRRSTLLRRR